ncbi:MAG TPA: phosphatase PAP2 family protein [Polyangiales bacterium]|nr:phosphatase PAP2 family protein [Polyangiales bacterium]
MERESRLLRFERGLEKLARFVTWILASAALFLLWFVSELSDRLFGRPVGTPNAVVKIDQKILVAVSQWRRPWLNGVAVDITALGTPTLLALFTVLALGVALANKQRLSALHLLIASSGAALFNLGLKALLTRARPTEVPRLVNVAGYSYPSGHSMGSAAILLTFAMVSWRYVHRPIHRVVITLIALLLIGAIGMSRISLGVHYPSDVLAGFALGIAWALLLEVVVRHLRAKRQPNTRNG